MRTLIVKKTAVLIGLILLFIRVSAQSDSLKKKICDRLISNKYIFEGEIVSTKYYTIKTGENTYANFNSYFIRVKKIIKGNIPNDTVEMIEPADGIIYKDNDHVEKVVSPEEMSVPTQAIYCGFDAPDSIKKTGNTNTNIKSIQCYPANVITLSNGELVKEKGGISRYFNKLTDFYAYLNTKYAGEIDTSSQNK